MFSCFSHQLFHFSYKRNSKVVFLGGEKHISYFFIGGKKFVHPPKIKMSPLSGRTFAHKRCVTQSVCLPTF